jgi:hypothetical protein
MDDPYDWELGYENISGRSRSTANGNVSTRHKSHTTAVKDKGPDIEKNRYAKFSNTFYRVIKKLKKFEKN